MLENLIFEAKKPIENVPDEELLFTAEELTTFGLDWEVFEELRELAQKMST